MIYNQLQYYIGCIDKSIKIYWHTLGKARGMKIHSSDIEWAISDDRSGPERIFSIKLSSGTASQRLDEIISEIKAGILPNGLLITPDSSPDNIVALMESKGFEIDYSSPGMVMELSEFDTCPQQSDEIEVIKVDNSEHLKAWADIVNNDFHIMSLEQFHDLFSLPEVFLYLSFYRDSPVGTFMIIKQDDFATLEMVNTLKEYQRRGIATAALKQILSDLKAAGIEAVTLRSSTEGIALYTKIGFKEYCKRILATYPESQAK